MDQRELQHQAELDALHKRYAAREVKDSRYQVTDAAALLSLQERHRVAISLLQSAGLSPMARLSLVEVGCGDGSNLLDFLRWGFAPQHLTGIELLPGRVDLARERLPSALTVLAGDAAAAPIAEHSADIVFSSTVFSSVLDDAVQQCLADAMWSWVKPGGGVLWYDFVFDNPSNNDVRAVPLRRVKALFPRGRMTVRRVTLAPPISRRVCQVHPATYHLLNLLPFLRTHVLCWIAKN